MNECEYNGIMRKIIPLAEMETGVIYKGQCRNATYAHWNGRKFVHQRTKFFDTFLEDIDHPENELNPRVDIFVVEKVADENDPEAIELREAIDNMTEWEKERYE